jgi:uncharacterized protein (DUF885 family)
MTTLLLLLACTKPTPPAAAVSADPPAIAAPDPSDSPIADQVVAGVADEGLRQLLLDDWEATARRSPGWATELGDDRFADQITDASLDARDAWLLGVQERVERARAFTALSPDDALTRDLFVAERQADLDVGVCRDDEWELSPRWNVLTAIDNLGLDANVDHAGEAEALLARFEAYADSVRVQTDNLRAGARDGLVANRTTIDKVVEQLDHGLTVPTGEHPVVTVILPDDVDAPAWRARARAILDERVRPALVAYRDVIANELRPLGRTGAEVGLTGLPIGEACYAARIRMHTSSDQPADTFHQTGLAELERIHGEFRALGEAVFGTQDLAVIFERLRTDPELRFETAEEVEATAREALARAEEAVPDVFGRLPETPCEVERVPEVQAPYTTIAYYRGPAPGDERPGRYYVNTYAPETRPRFEAEVLAFHESVPGHHLQIALNSELDELPLFRKHARVTVFVEGWGLYSERLSDELGLYSGDLDRLGMLSFDSWRASRLVVDTGIHHLGWTRAQAEQFMLENTPLAANNIANEVDRYITTPGQALAYKTGQLEILRMRREAEEALGDAFDLSDFHDAVLGGGALPMPMLDERMDAWVSARRPAP